MMKKLILFSVITFFCLYIYGQEGFYSKGGFTSSDTVSGTGKIATQYQLTEVSGVTPEAVGGQINDSLLNSPFMAAKLDNADTTNNKILSNYQAALNYLLLSDTSAFADLLRQAIEDSIAKLINEATSLGAVAPLLADTIPYFVFGYGVGNPLDTNSCAVNYCIGAWFNGSSDTIVNTKFIGVVKAGEGSPTAGVRFYYDANLFDGTPTAICDETNITSTTSGTEITSFSNQKIPPGVWVWGEIETVSVGNKPTALYITQLVYKISTY